ncbi:hypothetical protein V6N12_022386 [Hibiscus sabdariffa]|uniref:Uncharacterized protein n=1 Tax=Hibiscus sabdariffa TaxID=183260 RepID=A0ABR2FUU9_9ROSI
MMAEQEADCGSNSKPGPFISRKRGGFLSSRSSLAAATYTANSPSLDQCFTNAVLCLWPYDNNTGNRGQVLMKLKRWWPEKRSAGVFLLFHRWQARPSWGQLIFEKDSNSWALVFTLHRQLAFNNVAVAVSQ